MRACATLASWESPPGHDAKRDKPKARKTKNRWAPCPRSLKPSKTEPDNRAVVTEVRE